MKDRYVIGGCPRCHVLIIADSRYKSKTCPNCDSKVLVTELKVLQSARDSREARSVLSKAKALRGGLDQT